MLQTSAVEPGTLVALKKLMKVPSLKDFILVGGTGLALLKGHRLSIDIDLFSANIPINPDIIYLNLQKPESSLKKIFFHTLCFLSLIM